MMSDQQYMFRIYPNRLVLITIMRYFTPDRIAGCTCNDLLEIDMKQLELIIVRGLFVVTNILKNKFIRELCGGLITKYNKIDNCNLYGEILTVMLSVENNVIPIDLPHAIRINCDDKRNVSSLLKALHKRKNTNKFQFKTDYGYAGKINDFQHVFCDSVNNDEHYIGSGMHYDKMSNTIYHTKDKLEIIELHIYRTTHTKISFRYRHKLIITIGNHDDVLIDITNDHDCPLSECIEFVL